MRVHESVPVFNGSLEEQEFRTLPGPSSGAMLAPLQASRPRRFFGERQKGMRKGRGKEEEGEGEKGERETEALSIGEEPHCL